MCAQVDLDMLNVSLGTGTLEVCSALLNTEYLSAQLVRLTGLPSHCMHPGQCIWSLCGSMSCLDMQCLGSLCDQLRVAH